MATPVAKATRILGVDPGLQHTGWGIIESAGSQLSFIAAGAVTTNPKLSLPERLVELHEALAHLVAEYKPAQAAVEETFVNKNGATTLKLGQARGGILLSLALSGLPVFEYSANLVKKSLTGNGHAEKSQVALMVATLLPACRPALAHSRADASDALAVAICHAHHGSFH